MNQGGNDMYQANDGKWYPKQAMPQGWHQGSNGGYTGPNGAGQQQQYGGAQQGNYWGAAPHMYANQPMYIKNGRPAGGAGAAAGGGILAGLCCGALLC